MKSIHILLAFCLGIFVATAQPNSTTTASVHDSTTIVMTAADSLKSINPVNVIQADDSFRHATDLVTFEDKDYILYKGCAYLLDDVMMDHNYNMPVEFPENDDNLVSVVAICFIVPCITIVVALVLLLIFFMRKTVARNEIIARAIDANYTLPDSFYSNTQQPHYATIVEEPSDTPAGNDMNQIRPVPHTQRDPKKFTSAMTLLAVGLCMLLFFWINGYPALACLAGGLPLLLGVGNMIGYFYVPGYSESKTTRPKSPYPPQPGYGPSAARYNEPCPPPFNSTRTDNYKH